MAEMTKPEFENLLKKVDGINELLIRNDEKLIAIKKQLDDGSEKFDDHESRLRIIETWKNRIVAYAAVAGSVAGIIAGIIMSVIHKFY